MLDFDPSAHNFQVVVLNPQFALEFGPKKFFTSLVTSLPATEIEASMAAGGSLFNNRLVPPALLFNAECVVLVPQGSNPPTTAIAAVGHFRSTFEFGFVQGVRDSDVHLEYWGSTQALGRTIVDINMPGAFEVDTDPAIQPWTRVASRRFDVTAKGGARKLLFFKVAADFGDHPMYVFPHTLEHKPSNVMRFLRSIKFTRDFRTIFCFRDKSDRSFTPISAAEWSVRFRHLVSYTERGKKHSVENKIGAPGFPSSGSPLNVNNTDRDILAMAKRGLPFSTQAVRDERIKDAARRTETDDTPNGDFDPAFWS